MLIQILWTKYNWLVTIILNMQIIKVSLYINEIKGTTSIFILISCLCRLTRSLSSIPIVHQLIIRDHLSVININVSIKWEWWPSKHVNIIICKYNPLQLRLTLCSLLWDELSFFHHTRVCPFFISLNIPIKYFH